MGTPAEKSLGFAFFIYIINHIELNSSGKSQKQAIFSEKNIVGSENKAV